MVDNKKRLSVGVGLYTDEKSINAIKRDLRNVKEELENYVNSLSKASKESKSLSTAQKQLKDSMGQNASESKKSEKALIELQDQYARLERSIKKASVGMSRDNFNFDQANRIKSDMAGVIGAFERGEMSTTDAKNAIKLLNIEYQKLATNADVATKSQKIMAKESETVASKAVDVVKKFATWTLVSTAIYGTINAVREGVRTIIELDTAMVELRKVTNETEQAYEQFQKRAFDVAQELSAVTTDVINATSGFARMGYTMENALALGETAIILKNVGDGIDSIDQATNAIIATMKGFNFEADQSMKIIDSVNEVSNRFAVNTGALTEGIRRTSAVLNQTNTTFDETLGLLTGGIEVIQNTEKVSSGLITISSRLRGMKEDGEEIPGLISELGDAFQRIAGIDIQDQNGELRSTYDILSELAEVYPTLNSGQQQYLAELSAGKRQVPVLQAILQNWESVNKATATSADSAGSALTEMENYTNSLQGQINRLKASTEEFWATLIDEGVITGFISFLSEIVELGQMGAEHIGELTVAMSAFMTVIAVQKIQASAVAITSLGTAIQALGIKSSVVMGILNPLALAIGAVAFVTSSMVKSAVDAKKAQDDYNDALEEYNDIIEDRPSRLTEFTKAEINKVQQLTSEYQKLTEQYKDALAEAQNFSNKSEEQSKRQIEATNDLRSEIQELEVELLKMGLTGEEAVDVMAAMAQGSRYAARAAKEGADDTQDAQETIDDAVNESKYNHEEYIESLISDYDYLSDRQKDQVLTYLNREMDKTRITIEQAKARIKALKEEYEQRRKIMIAELGVQVASGSMTDMEAERRIGRMSMINFNEQVRLNQILDEATVSYNKLAETYDKVTKAKKESSVATKQEIELMTDNERALRDNASALNILEQELARAEGDEVKPILEAQMMLYEERLELLNKQKKELEEQKSLIDTTNKEGLKEMEQLESEILAVEEERQSVMTTIHQAQMEQKKALEEYQKQQEKFAHDLRMRIESALKESYKRDLENFKRNQEEKKRKIDEEIEALERRFDTDVYEKEQEELNDRIAKLVKERKMLEIEGSLDAKKRISEIDKEVYDLKEELAENEAKRQFEIEKQKLEDAKDRIDEETRAEEEKYRMMMEVNKEYIQEASRIMQEGMEGSFEKIIELLGAFDEDFMRDGDLKGLEWAGGFKGHVLNAFKFMQEMFNKNIMPDFGGGGEEGGGKPKPEKPSPDKSSGGSGGSRFGDSVRDQTNKRVYENIKDEFGKEEAEKWAKSAGYADGGMLDYTGLASVHGTTTSPEAVLSSEDTKIFRNDLPQLLTMLKDGTSGGMQALDMPVSINVYPSSNLDAESSGKSFAKGMKEGLLQQGFRLQRK